MAQNPAEPDPEEQRRRRIAEAAQRALAEAEARRRGSKPNEAPAEHGGPKGPEPTRHGDWERDGIASDF